MSIYTFFRTFNCDKKEQKALIKHLAFIRMQSTLKLPTIYVPAKEG